MNKDIKVEDNKQKFSDACPAETEADSEPQPKTTTSRPACSNTFVSRRVCLGVTTKGMFAISLVVPMAEIVIIKL